MMRSSLLRRQHAGVIRVDEFLLGAPPVGVEPIGGRGAAPVAPSKGVLAGDRVTVDIAVGQRGDALDPSELSWQTLHTVRAVSWQRGGSGVGLPHPSSIVVEADASAGSLDVLGGGVSMSDPVRIRLDNTANAALQPLAWGHVTSARSQFQWPSVASVSLRAVDGLRMLARRPLAADVPSNTVSVMVHAVLDQAGWPAARRVVQDSVRRGVALVAGGGTCLDAINDLTRAEGPTASRWVGNDGRFRWRARRALTSRARSVTPAATFSALQASDAARWAALHVGLDDVDVYPRAEVTDDGSGVVYVAEDAAQVIAVGPLTQRYNARYTLPADGRVDADLLVALHAHSAPQVRTLVVRPVADDAAFAALAALDIGDRVRCEIVAPHNLTDVHTIDSHIRAIGWDVQPGAQCAVTLTLSPAAPYDMLGGAW